MKKPEICQLMTAVIQLQDQENAVRALQRAGFQTNVMSSSGGFLGRRNVTLLIGLPDNSEAAAVEALTRNCRQRVEYLATQLEGAPFQIPLSTPVTVGGATIFTIKVEHYEEL